MAWYLRSGDLQSKNLFAASSTVQWVWRNPYVAPPQSQVAHPHMLHLSELNSLPDLSLHELQKTSMLIILVDVFPGPWTLLQLKALKETVPQLQIGISLLAHGSLTPLLRCFPDYFLTECFFYSPAISILSPEHFRYYHVLENELGTLQRYLAERQLSWNYVGVLDFFKAPFFISDVLSNALSGFPAHGLPARADFNKEQQSLKRILHFSEFSEVSSWAQHLLGKKSDYFFLSLGGARLFFFLRSLLLFSTIRLQRGAGALRAYSSRVWNKALYWPLKNFIRWAWGKVNWRPPVYIGRASGQIWWRCRVFYQRGHNCFLRLNDQIGWRKHVAAMRARGRVQSVVITAFVLIARAWGKVNWRPGVFFTSSLDRLRGRCVVVYWQVHRSVHRTFWRGHTFFWALYPRLCRVIRMLLYPLFKIYYFAEYQYRKRILKEGGKLEDFNHNPHS